MAATTQDVDTTPQSAALPSAPRSGRRGSVSSIRSHSHLDKKSLAVALDQIHSTASRSNKLTTFNDFTTSPSTSTNGDNQSLTGQLVPNSLTNILSRFKSPAAGSKDGENRDTTQASLPARVAPDLSIQAQAPSTTSVATSAKSLLTSSPLQSPVSENSTAASQRSRRQSYDRHSRESSTTKPTQHSRNGSIKNANLNPSVETDSRSLSSASQNSHSTVAQESKQHLAMKRSSTDRYSLDHERSSPHSERTSNSSKATGRKSLDDSRRHGSFQDSRQGSPSAPRHTSLQTTTVLPPSTKPKIVNEAVKSFRSESPNAVKRSDSSFDKSKSLQKSLLVDSNSQSAAVHRSGTANRRHAGGQADLAIDTARHHSKHADRPSDSRKSHSAALVNQMKRKILSRDFWMKDENAKVCFHCGDSFSTFRRKHHCRLCGQIYCGSCTNLISGKPFGQTSKLRVCKTCETMLYGDDSSDYSDEDEIASALPSRQIRFSDSPLISGEGHMPSKSDSTNSFERLHSFHNSSTNRRSQELRPFSAGSAYDPHSSLSRPGSSRSIKSLRPRSSSHRQSRVRHQHMRSLSVTTVDEVPFQHRASDHVGAPGDHLPAFHKDSIIDPDLAPYMSDDSSEYEVPTIASRLSTSNTNLHDVAVGSPFGASRNGASKAVGRKYLEPNHRARLDADNTSIASSRASARPPMKTRTLSTGSMTRHTTSSRVIRSDNLFKSSDDLLALTRGQTVSADLLSAEDEPTRRADVHRAEAQNVELNQTCLEYAKKLLRQFLEDAEIKHQRNWAKTLMPILLRCAGSVNLDIQRGDDIDIRHYVKIKKAPGGVPHDSTYVSGVVFTKNVAVKGMKRGIKNPRILLISFPVEYARQESHFMSLDPVIAQEREYLRNMVRRIVALRPSLLIVHRQVSGMALQFLREANITVICNVKMSVLQAVSRCTQTRIVTSVDRLTMDPNNLGKCDLFEIKTFIHQGVKKSYTYLSGCQSDLGCTIVLRGSDRITLAQLKKITEFMCYVTYNLKLESSLMRDQFLFMPSQIDSSKGKKETELLAQPDNGKEHLSKEIAETLGLDGDGDGVQEDQHDLEKSATRASEDVPICEDMAPDSMYENIQNRLLSISPYVQLAEPFLITKGREEEQKMAKIRKLQRERHRYSTMNPSVPYDPSTPDFQLVKPEMIYKSIKNSTTQVQEIVKAIHKAEYEKSSQYHSTLKRKWEAFIAGQAHPFSPFTHQRIVFLFSIVSTPTADACEGPDLIGLDYYREHDIQEGQEPDIPLGEYVERLCNQAEYPCVAQQCERKMIDHHRQYVHGYGQVNVYVQRLASRFKGMENTILMWSKCTKCESETQVTPMSSDAWKYSFAKYLELTFWSSPMHPRAGDCIHDVHREHIKYFGFKNLAVRVEFEPIKIMEVTVPKPTITWKIENDLRMKNEQYERLEEMMNKFVSSVRLRIKSINIDAINPTDIQLCKAEVEDMSKRLENNHAAMIKKLREKYAASKYFEIIPLNRAVRFTQELVGEWDASFAEFEKNFFPSEKDIRRLAALQLEKVFLEEEEESDLPSGETDEKTALRTTDKGANDTVRLEKLSIAGANSPPDVPSKVSEQHEKQLVENLDLAVPIEIEHVLSHESKVSSSGVHSTDGDQGTLAHAASSDLISHIVTGDSQSTAKIEEHKPEGAEVVTPKPRPERYSSALPRPGNGRTSPTLVRSRTQPLIPLYRVLQHKDGRETEPSALPQPPKAGRPLLESTLPSRSIADKEISAPPKEVVSRESSQSTPNRSTRSSMPSMIPRAINSKRRDSKVSELAKHFEKMSREFEREQLRERRQRAARLNQSRVHPAAASKPIVEVFKDASEAVHERENSYAHLTTNAPFDNVDGKSSTHVAGTPPALPLQSIDAETQQPAITEVKTAEEDDTIEDEQNGLSSYAPSEVEGITSDNEEDQATDSKASIDEIGKVSEASNEPTLEIPKHERTSLMKMLTSFWSERSASGWAALDYPLGPTEHIFADSDVIVHEDEPSSLIAFSLASQDYVSKMRKYHERAQASTVEAERNQDAPSPEQSEDQSTERIMLGSTATHMKYQFQSGPSRMQCKIFYAEAFEAMRRKCGVAERFVESLSRCVKWESKGGKTKSLFLKTLDERLVMKSLSPVEVHAFLKFAPDYFDYMSKCLFHGLPSTLAKIIGIFQVVIKNPVTGTDFSYFLQVMENVLYEGVPDRMFDLKGSMRNRKIQSTGEKDEVLLDENLLDYISQSPVYVRNHSSSLLTSSISNDTLFCSKQNVMDYSLIVGLYDQRRELIVGIIDYIRTYTWDKKLESWIKDRGKHKPTVRSPKDYRNRFRASIPRYFPLAPSRWQLFALGGNVQGDRAALWHSRGAIEAVGGEDSQDEVAIMSGAGVRSDADT